eukprot:c13198_g1_i1.p1 GENE.c13198_g1_i1~~c13198_g1_i1.p1  ORF type:complete len:487 (-),score=182.90 c13198_g1_i1:22-1302(-)
MKTKGNRYSQTSSSLLSKGKKKQLLIKNTNKWPSVNNIGLGITMKKVLSPEGNYFCLEYSKRYRHFQQEYHHGVASHEPQLLVNLLSSCPYHVDTLLQLSEVARHSGDAEAAFDFIQMAIHGLENSFHPEFDLGSGTCRVPFAIEENRSLFRALFIYMQILGRTGAHKSAFECSKIILMLDPANDTLNSLLLYDYYALRSREYTILVNTVKYFPWKDLSIMPNFAFSRAIAQHLLEQSNEYSNEINNTISGDELLLQALAMFPSFLSLVLNKIHQSREWRWIPILTSNPFTSTESHHHDLSHLISVYAERTKSIWKEADINKWLQKICEKLIEDIKSDESVLHSYSVAVVEAYPESFALCSSVRMEEYATDQSLSLPDDKYPAFGWKDYLESQRNGGNEIFDHLDQETIEYLFRRLVMGRHENPPN